MITTGDIHQLTWDDLLPAPAPDATPAPRRLSPPESGNCTAILLHERSTIWGSAVNRVTIAAGVSWDECERLIAEAIAESPGWWTGSEIATEGR